VFLLGLVVPGLLSAQLLRSERHCSLHPHCRDRRSRRVFRVTHLDVLCGYLQLHFAICDLAAASDPNGAYSRANWDSATSAVRIRTSAVQVWGYRRDYRNARGWFPRERDPPPVSSASWRPSVPFETARAQVIGPLPFEHRHSRDRRTGQPKYSERIAKICEKATKRKPQLSKLNSATSQVTPQAIGCY
jgi:hypothetical protein